MAAKPDFPVTYFEQEGAPGKYFACAHYGTMSVNACARNFTDAPHSVKQGRLQRCIGCSVGATHAGVDAPPAASPPSSSIVYRPACVRCRRDGRTQGSRLVGRMRLVRGGTICVSCFNREKEVVSGANAKGAKPRKWSGLFFSSVTYVTWSRAVVQVHPDPVVDRIELALTMLRRGHERGVAWSRPPVLIPLEA
ncbi:hypothetical protein D7S86_27190 [Pararobbsia silviterrae]|uniref:Uncharacterized protein n=1 Tax=Pararobbsia silviterrae TaxID=1792498 RepID=A0A494X1W9_9BURK|nr:hypothetical protein D7S86_27190 [Pararobbsia silviterrae]